MDESAAQLHDELQKSLQDDLATRRPLLHDLHHAWLLQLPRPVVAIRNGARFYYNVLIFKYAQSDGAPVASAEWISMINGCETLVEGLKAEAVAGRKGNGVVNGHDEEGSLIDVVIVSASDVQRKALLYIHPDVPIFASAQAAEQISMLQHFRDVVVMPVFGSQAGVSDWRSSSLLPLPQWLGISQMPQIDNNNAALMVTFNIQHENMPARLVKPAAKTRESRKRHYATIEPDEDDEAAEAILYVPSAVGCQGVEVITTASPSISTLALLCDSNATKPMSGTHVRMSGMVEAQRRSKVKYWICTNGEVEAFNGTTSWFAPRAILTLKQFVDRAWKRKETKCGTSGVRQDGDEGLDVSQSIEWLESSAGMSRILR